MYCKLQAKEREVRKKASLTCEKIRPIEKCLPRCHQVKFTHDSHMRVPTNSWNLSHKTCRMENSLYARKYVSEKQLKNHFISLNNSKQWHFGGVIVLFARMRVSKMGKVSN